MLSIGDNEFLPGGRLVNQPSQVSLGFFQGDAFRQGRSLWAGKGEKVVVSPKQRREPEIRVSNDKKPSLALLRLEFGPRADERFLDVVGHFEPELFADTLHLDVLGEDIAEDAIDVFVAAYLKQSAEQFGA